MHTLPTKLYRAEQVRELDRIAIEERGIPGSQLMVMAGQAAFQYIREYYPHIKSLAVFCGAGNNAGDGYIVARLALQASMRVQVYAVASPETLRGDALTAYRQYADKGGSTEMYQQGVDSDRGLIVDALLGTGLNKEVGGLYAAAVAAINRSRAPVISLDIPSGLNADTGKVFGSAVHADATVSFIGLKQGLFTGDAAEYCGRIAFASLGVPDDIYRQVNHAALRITRPSMLRRNRCAHKGNYGHVLVIGGEKGFSGAARMSAEAAARVGAGLVSVATRSEHAGLLSVSRPEIMSHGVEHAEQLQPLLHRATVIVVGPGLGQSNWARDLLHAAIAAQKPMVIDADGLNLLAKSPQSYSHWVLTPHPGEAGRLLSCSTAEIQRDRFHAVTQLQTKYHGICVLKGSGTLIDDSFDISVSTMGNAGMASGGFGDILSGAIAGLIAQGLTLSEASKMAVYLHGEAADIAVTDGQRGMLATDLLPHLRRLVNRS